jgi:hypothetical protein
MSATLRHASSLLRLWGRKFYEARQAKAQQVVDEHRRLHRPEALGSGFIPF